MRPRRRAAGPYLERRGAVFYFRKRTPRTLVQGESDSCMRLSLRTHVLRIAVTRAAALLTAFEQAERRRMTTTQVEQLDEARIKSILAEVLRDALQRVLRQEAEDIGICDEAIDARIAEIGAERDALRRSARARDWSQVEPEVACAAQHVNMAVPTPLPSEPGRPATSLIREIREVEGPALDGEDARQLPGSGRAKLPGRPLPLATIPPPWAI